MNQPRFQRTFHNYGSSQRALDMGFIFCTLTTKLFGLQQEEKSKTLVQIGIHKGDLVVCSTDHFDALTDTQKVLVMREMLAGVEALKESDETRPLYEKYMGAFREYVLGKVPEIFLLANYPQQSSDFAYPVCSIARPITLQNGTRTRRVVAFLGYTETGEAQVHYTPFYLCLEEEKRQKVDYITDHIVLPMMNTKVVGEEGLVTTLCNLLHEFRGSRDNTIRQLIDNWQSELLDTLEKIKEDVAEAVAEYSRNSYIGGGREVLVPISSSTALSR